MTSPYSENFTKGKAQDTVSQTGKRSQFSESMISQTHDSANSYSFDVQSRNVTPLIEQINQQNQHLKQQKETMKQEMQQIKSISETVLEQNAQLRRHYNERTADVQKLVSTITINMNQNIQDLNHQIHMVRSHNYSLVKYIQASKSQIAETDGDNQRIEEELARLAEKHTNLEEEMISRRVKINYLEDKLSEVKETQTREDNVFELENEVDQLMTDVNNLRQKNHEKLKNVRQIADKNETDKPIYTAENVNAIQNIKILRQELAQLGQDEAATLKSVENLRDKNQKLIQKCKEGYQQRQRNKMQHDETQEQIKSYKARILKAKQTNKKTVSSKSQLQDEKYYLEKQISKRKHQIQKLKAKQKTEQQGLVRQFQKNVSKLRSQSHIRLQKNNDEVVYKLNPQKEKKSGQVEQGREQYEVLCEKIEEIRRKVEEMDNPVKEIVRMEYELRRLGI